jgi:hypothetical protein
LKRNIDSQNRENKVGDLKILKITKMVFWLLVLFAQLWAFHNVIKYNKFDEKDYVFIKKKFGETSEVVSLTFFS